LVRDFVAPKKFQINGTFDFVSHQNRALIFAIRSTMMREALAAAASA
jgi:hypothetical protein